VFRLIQIIIFLEIHQAAKETVALAEARFLSKQHEWKFDSAWQEMLNHAIIKVKYEYYLFIEGYTKLTRLSVIKMFVYIVR
jgi:hypothetical protein